MRVAIDGHNLSLEKGTGIATYARHVSLAVSQGGGAVDVLYGLPPATGSNPLLREIAFFDPSAHHEPAWAKRSRYRRMLVKGWFGLNADLVPMNGAVVVEPFRTRLPYYDALWNIPDLFEVAQLHFRRFGRFLKVKLPSRPEVVHWTYPTPIQAVGAANIYTLHDLIPLRLPYTTTDVKREYLAMIDVIARKADRIVTVSECSKTDIEQLFPQAKGRVENLYQSVLIPKALLSKDERRLRDEVSGTFRLEPGRYLLFFGAIEPKKNVGRLIEAFLAANLDIPLVLVGSRAWKSEQELRLLEGRRGRRVILLDYATFPQLISLIRAARAVAFPSIYEGFGLPVLEAMMCGTPVLTSRTSSLIEVASPESALLVDPYDVNEIREGLYRLATDDALCAQLSEAGRRRSEHFAWPDYVRRLNDLYARVAGEHTKAQRRPRFAPAA